MWNAGMVPTKVKVHSVILLILAILFFLFFDISKHNPEFSPVNPFADDPYDAISTYALQGSIFFTLLALIRSYRKYQGGQPDADQVTYLVRSQMAASLTLLTALSSDLVSLGRYFSMWFGSTGGIRLVLLTAGFFVLLFAISIYLWLTTWQKNLPGATGPWWLSLAVTLIFVLTLLVYPAGWRDSLPGAIVTVVTGSVLLFSMVRVWEKALSPDRFLHKPATLPGWLWGVTIAAGGITGLSMVLRELFGNGTIELAGKFSVIAVFIGLEITGMLIGLALLGNYIGLAELIKREPYGQSHHQ